MADELPAKQPARARAVGPLKAPRTPKPVARRRAAPVEAPRPRAVPVREAVPVAEVVPEASSGVSPEARAEAARRSKQALALLGPEAKLRRRAMKALKRAWVPAVAYLIWSISFGFGVNAIIGISILYVAVFIVLPDILDL